MSSCTRKVGIIQPTVSPLPTSSKKADSLFVFAFLYRFAVTPEMVEPFLEGKTFNEAMKRKKLYLMDLAYLTSMECTDNRKVRHDSKLLYDPHLITCYLAAHCVY